MKYLIIKDKKNRKRVEKYYLNLVLAKYFLSNELLSKHFRKDFFFENIVQKLPRTAFPTRIRNRCLITGRSGSNYSFFKLSRYFLRDYATLGKLPGIKKSSW